MSVSDTTTLASAQRDYELREWSSAFALFLEADAADPLAAEDVERMAWAARWCGKYDEQFAAFERAEKLYTQAGDSRGAARMAIHFGYGMFEHRKSAVGFACFTRAAELLGDDSQCAERAWFAFFSSMVYSTIGDLDKALAFATEACEIATLVGDRDLEAMAKLSLGHVHLSKGNIDQGVKLHDEAGAAAMTAGLGPYASGYIYCSMIVACRNRADWQRASEWTDQATRWCDDASVQYFPGLCRVHRAEVLRFRGSFDDAEISATDARDLLAAASPYASGMAHAEIAEISLRRGDLAEARESCRRALEVGAEPQPTFAKLLLAEGDIDGALQSIEGSLNSSSLGYAQCHVGLLPVKVTIAIAAKQTDVAKEAVEALKGLAATLDTAAPLASAACAQGELDLVLGDYPSAAGNLRKAWQLWCEIGAPHDAANAQALLASALAGQGRSGDAMIQLEAAQACLERIGAVRDAGRVAAQIAALARTRSAPASSEDTEKTRKTFMFTDIVDSTKLVELLGDESWDALQQWHHRKLRECFAQNNGEEVGCEGDGFFVAFDHPADALRCAVGIQRRLAEHRVSQGFAPQVRVGVHQAEVLRRGDEYAGKGIHTAARIAAIGGANDIVASVQTLDNSKLDLTASAPQSLQLKGLSTRVDVVTVEWRQPR